MRPSSSRIFRFLRSGDGRIPTDWFANQLSFCDRLDGDIDTISNRISHIRTWTFVANRTWLADPVHWQLRARAIEDKLSDALHERLTQRFIDRRTSVLMKRIEQREALTSTVEHDGTIQVEGECVGHMRGLTFVPAEATDDAHERALRAASLKAVAREVEARAQVIAASPDPDLSLSRDGQLIWQSASIARLEPGHEVLKPRIELLAGSELSVSDRDAVQLRLERWLGRHIAALLQPLLDLAEDENVTGLARGIAFRLQEQLGVIQRDQIAADVKALGQDDRATLRKHGVRFGAFHIFIPALLKPAASQLRLLLWGISLEQSRAVVRSTVPELPGQGLTSLPFDPATPKGFYRVAGFRICGSRCVRIDMLERLGDLIRDRVFWRPRVPDEQRPSGSVEGGGFTVVADMMSLVGCSGEEFAAILRSLGFRMERRMRPALDGIQASASNAPAAAMAEANDSDSPAPAEVDGATEGATPAGNAAALSRSSRSGGRGTPGLSGLVSAYNATFHLRNTRVRAHRRGLVVAKGQSLTCMSGKSRRPRMQKFLTPLPHSPCSMASGRNCTPARRMAESNGRLDKWLWCARIVRTRKLAHDMVTAGVVRLNRAKVDKPGHEVRPGDVLTFVWGDRLRILKVLAIPQRRDQAASARLLYEELPVRD